MKKAIVYTLLTATLVTGASLYSPEPASAGPILCLGAAAGSILGWLGYGAVRVVTAPTIVLTAAGEVVAVATIGKANIELVMSLCGMPSP